MKYPKKLREGAIIGLAAPSSPVSSERVMQCRAVLEAMGFKVIMADNLAVSKGGYMAEPAGLTKCLLTRR